MEAKNPGRGALAVRIVKTVVSVVLAIVLAVAMMLANPQLSNKIIPGVPGLKQQSVDNGKINAQGANADYYTTKYTKDSIKAAENKLYDRITSEGTVLLKNDDNMLPMSKGTKFSLFSANSVSSAAGTSTNLSTVKPVTLNDAFSKAGFGVNQKLWDFYEKGAGKDYGLAPGSVDYGSAENFRINEAPLSKLQQEPGLLDSTKGTVPVYVLSRVAGEGRDMPRSMYNHATSEEDKEKSYLEPDSTELGILRYLNDNFDNVLLYVKSNAAMKLSWVSQFPHIKAIVYSQDVSNAVAQVVAGTVNPSGRTVDTFETDPLSSPAAQNFGSYQYYDENDKPTKYNYVDYAEGMYVGYKYYETRYEDKVLNQGNAGNYDYTKSVMYPFGYGLSFTNFQWNDFSVKQNGNSFTAQVSVKNTGHMAGKDVVELYAQSPYTDYDKANHVEKSAVELVGYAETSDIAPGATQTVNVTFTTDQLKAYDSHGAKTYILDPGEYRFTVATNANQAVNNILADKGKTQADGMTGAGDTKLVSRWTPQNKEVDTASFAKDSKTNTRITNLFDAASDPDVTYLTRSDWTGTFPKHYGQSSGKIDTWGDEINCTDSNGNKASCTWKKTADKELLRKLDGNDSGTDVKRDSIKDTLTFGKKNGLKLSEMRGLDFSDGKWNKLLDQMTAKEYNQLIEFSGYGVDYIHSVDKPYQLDADAANGWFYGGTGRRFTTVTVLAQTYNQNLAEEYGKMMGDEALLGGADGWYAPAMNIHRTPFSGRNGEYYSEDGYLSGQVASLEVKGAASKGVYAYIKHFALNDQENHRGDRPGNFVVATWSNEQAPREIYLKPFEMCMKLGDTDMNYVKKAADGSYRNATRTTPTAKGVMTGFNRIGATWTGGSYPLIQQLLRDEWGFDGSVITDNANTAKYMSPYQMIEAGSDIKLLNANKDPTEEKLDLNDPATYHYARQAAHHVLYTMCCTR